VKDEFQAYLKCIRKLRKLGYLEPDLDATVATGYDLNGQNIQTRLYTQRNQVI
jgi:hypothetical protein